MKVTYESLKNYAFQHLISQNFATSTKALINLLQKDLLDLDLRFWAIEIFEHTNHQDLLLNSVEFSAKLAIKSGHPAAAIAFIEIFEQNGANAKYLWDMLTEYYSKSSQFISQYGGRIAPLSGDTPVEAPEESDIINNSMLNELFLLLTSEEAFKDLPSQLQGMPLLSDLESDVFKTVVTKLKLHKLYTNEKIIKEGETGTSFFFLANGKMNVYKTDFQGKSNILAHLHSGAIFGEMALVQHAPRSASVASEKLSYVLEFTVASLTEIADNIAPLASALDNFTRERLLKNLINTNKLFKPFSGSQKKDLLRHFQAYVVDSDTEIIKENEQGTGLYLVLSGEVDVIKNKGTANEIKIATIYATESFGEISLLSEIPTTASVVAAQRTTLLFLSKHYFSKLLQSVPQLKSYFEQLGRERLQNTEEIVNSQYYNTEENDEFILI